jgi:adenosine deaminase
LDKIIFGALVGMKHACMEYPVRAGLIVMMDRRFPKEQNLIIAQKAARFAGEGVVGIDIAGPITKDFHVADLVDAVKVARDAGLKVTIHTGEVTGADEMWEVVKLLKPDRIGHGIHAVDDEKLMAHLKEHNIVLEVCPTSNLQTSAVKTWDEMGEVLRTLKENNVPFTINSDGPELLGITVKEEFETLLEKKFLTIDDVIECTKTSKNATFIP